MKTNSRVIENANPEILEILLHGSASVEMPTPPDSLSDLIAVTVTQDPDDEPVELDYTWSRDGFVIPDLDGSDRVDQIRLEPGQEWEVIVTATDPWGLSANLSAHTIISNIAPVASWTVTPSPP